MGGVFSVGNVPSTAGSFISFVLFVLFMSWLFFFPRSTVHPSIRRLVFSADMARLNGDNTRTPTGKNNRPGQIATPRPALLLHGAEQSAVQRVQGAPSLSLRAGHHFQRNCRQTHAVYPARLHLQSSHSGIFGFLVRSRRQTD